MRQTPTLFRIFLWCLLGACQFFACKNTAFSPVDHPRTTDSLIDHFNDLLKLGDSKRYAHYLDSAYGHFPLAGPGDRWKKYSQQANYYLNYELEAGKARLYTDSMNAAIAGMTDHYPNLYAQTLFTDGDVLMAERRFGDAFDRYYDGLLFAQAHLDSCSLTRFNNMLGLVKYRQGKYPDAIPYIKRALRENSYCDSSSAYLANSMFNTIALCFERSGRPDSAVRYYQSALRLLHRGVLRHAYDTVYLNAAKGVIYGNLGGLNSKLRRYAQAEHYLKQSIAINNRPGYEMNDAITAELKLAQLYLDTKRNSAADSILKQASFDLDRQQARHQTDYGLQVQWSQLRWQYFDQLARLPEAYATAKRYYQLRDSMETIKKGLQAADMETAFQASRQERKLELLTKDNEIKRISLRTTTILAVMAIVIIVIIVISLRKHRRQLTELKRLNSTITEQNGQLQNAISALEQSQLEVAEKNHFLQGLLNNLPVILYQINPEGIITTSTGAGLKAVPGWSNDQLVGLNAFSLAADLADVFRMAMAGEYARAINTFKIGGDEFYFDTIVIPDVTRPGGIIGFAIDVTTAKKGEQQLKQLNAFKDKLISVISHDLRQPFSSILLASEVLKLGDGNLTKDELETIMLELVDTATKGISLLEGILCWVQVEKENFQYKPQPIDLHDNVAEANGIYAYSQQQKQIKLLNTVPEDLIIMAHHQMLLFINRNLISNATKYSPRGGVITLAAKNDGKQILVTVTDQGPGMTVEQLSELFHVQEWHSPDSRRGAGIALSICYDMVQQMNGRIWAESEPGKGATFCYSLPLIDSVFSNKS